MSNGIYRIYDGYKKNMAAPKEQNTHVTVILGKYKDSRTGRDEECNMKEFFVYAREIPAGKGFELFSTGHLVWIVGSIIFAGVFSLWYVKKERKLQNRINKIISVCLVMGGMLRDVILAVRGYFTVGFLPLHLCSMAMFIAVIYSFFNNRYWGMVYLLICLPGAFGALLFPNWGVYPFFTYMNINAFLSHCFLITFGIAQYVSGRLLPKWRDIWIPISFGAMGTLVIYNFNKHFGTNFWFLNRPSAGSPLVTISDLFGPELYLPVYFVFCIFIVMIWMGILIIVHYVNQDKGKDILAKLAENGILKDEKKNLENG